jgi:heme/copper-type cytochrome/quinol oxidase subunit 2|tara:strand:- start:3189 stop:3506 length:318 start_codon:yes stop_codon:yes gene_type:complete
MKMITHHPFKLVVQESIGVIKETSLDAIAIILGAVALIFILVIVAAFFMLPALMAIYFEVMPEYTGFTIFENWVTTTTCLWSAFWLVSGARLHKRLKVKKESSKC